MEELGIKPKRSLGQNFLCSEHIVVEIIEAVKSTKPKAIIEIGPGTGVLTERLITLGLPYRAIEMDHALAGYWRQRGVEVMEQDALHCEWQKMEVSSHTCLVSNLPYQIAARIVVEMSIGPKNVESMVLMFQKEVAERVAAKTNSDDYGFLSVIGAMGFATNKVCDARPNDFYPAPKVTSRVLKFKRKAQLDQEFINFTKTLFQQRRKYLIKQIPEPKAPILDRLLSLGYSDRVRVSELKPEHFMDLYQVYRGL
jgi:16S rRNA (adenine1518-N6/adenine1519-N6)-dimethyltransferase